MPEISIVIPVYNSAAIVSEICRRINDSLATIHHEIILVNDNSMDASWEKIEAAFLRHENIIGINLRKNYGQDNAIMAGLRHASGNYTVIMDDDLQHNPADIVRLYEKCRQGYDVCYAGFNKKKQAAWKNLGSWINGKVAEILLKKPKAVYLSPFQIVSKEIVDRIIDYEGPYPYIQGLLLDHTDNLSQVEVDHHNRYAGQSNFNLIKSIKVFSNLITSFSIVPLRLATITGFISSSVGFMLVLFYLYRYFWGNRIVEGWTTIVLLQLVFGGFILLSLGIIGEYIGRLCLNINKKPQYNIKTVVSYKDNRHLHNGAE